MSERQKKSDEQLKSSILKKKQCQETALKIIERLIDEPVTPDNLKQLCLHINNAVYKDLTEERAILLKCGYPLCSKSIKKFPKQKYHISLKHHKVFDISERKNYCSNHCFKASIFLQEQLPTCPLWLLEDEVRPPMTFLVEDENKSEGLGQAVDLGYADIQESKRRQAEIAREIIASRDAAKASTSATLSQQFSDLSVSGTRASVIRSSTECHTAAPTTDERQGATPTDRFSTDRRRIPKKTMMRSVAGPPLSPVQVVERSLGQWVTLETRKFLIDNDSLRRLLPSSSSGDESMAEAQMPVDPHFWDRYEELCQTLDAQELEDCALDKEILTKDRAATERKNMLAYEHLTQEAKLFNLKVHAYYKGKTDVSSGDTDSGDHTLEKPEEDGNAKPSMPLVDSQSQKSLRRRLVLDKINRMSSEVVHNMGIKSHELTSDFRELVWTFNLQANNITFKPAEWTLVILILIQMLGFRDEKIRKSIQEESFKKLLHILLRSYQVDFDYLGRITKKLMGF